MGCITIKEYDLRNCFKTERILLTLTGFYPKRNNKFRFLYIFSAFINLVVSYTQLFSMIIQIILDRKDLSKLSECLLYLVTVITFLLKLTNFLYYRNNLLEIEDNLTDSIFYGFEHDKLKILKNKVGSCKLVAKIFRTLCVIAVILYVIPPYVDRNIKSLPLPGWQPYNVSRYYHLRVLFQMSGVCITAYNNSTIDILTWMMITIASAQFDLLKENLKAINYDEDERLPRKNISSRFNKCVDHHIKIINLINLIEFTFSKGIFIQFFASIVVICFTGFRMIVVPVMSVEFGFLLMYFMCMMCQVAMYCWYGHDIMTTSNDIGYSLYMSNWYATPAKMKYNFFIFLERTKRPIKLTAWKFVTLSLTTFTGILRTSYSYFAVLQHLYNNSYNI